MVRVMVPKAGGGWEPATSPPTDHGSLTGNTVGDPHPQYMRTTEDALTRYMRKDGANNINGQVETRDHIDSVVLHHGGRSIMRLSPAYHAQNALWVRRYDKAGHAPVEAARPSNNAHATDPYYARTYRQMRLSGPHGGSNGWGGSGYYDAAVGSWTAMPGGAVQTVAHWEPGRYRVFCLTYLAITGLPAGSGEHHTMHLGILVRWHDGAGAGWRNSCAIADYRFTIAQGMYSSGSGYCWAFADGWIENRPGYHLTYCGAAMADQAGGNKRFGNNYRVGHEFWPYNSAEGGLDGGWRNW